MPKQTEEEYYREELERFNRASKQVRKMGLCRGIDPDPPALNPDGSYADADAYEQDGDEEGETEENDGPAANVFCPTGEGGKVDDSCPPTGGGGGAAHDDDSNTVVSGVQAEKLLTNHATEVNQQLGQHHLDAIESYTSMDGYAGLNRAMRSCPPNFECVQGDEKTKLDNIEDAIKISGKFPQPVMVHRGLVCGNSQTAAALAHAAQTALDGGHEFKMPSLTSTSTKDKVAQVSPTSKDRGIAFKITARTGIYVDQISANKGEREMIQSAHTRYKVAKVEKTEVGGHVIHLEEMS